MRSNRINYVVVGGFVILMLIGLVISVALLTGRTGATDAYNTYFSNVTGVKFGTQVVYEGYPIGQVEAVTPEESDGRMRFRVDFEVQEGWRIPRDSLVQIEAPGLLAAVTLAISAGASPEPLAPGEYVTAVEGANLFAVVSDVAGKVGKLADENLGPLLDGVTKAVANVNRMLGDEGDLMIKDLTLMIQDATAVIGDLAVRIPELTGDLETIADDVLLVSQELRDFATPQNFDKLEDTVNQMQQAARRTNEVLGASQDMIERLDVMVENQGPDVQQSVKELRYIVESVGRHVDAINENMEGMSRNMLEFSRQIRQSPGLLLTSKPVEDDAVSSGGQPQ